MSLAQSVCIGGEIKKTGNFYIIYNLKGEYLGKGST